MKKFLSLPNQRINLSKNVNRMDPVQYTVDSTLMDSHLNPVGEFPKDFFPMMAKKYHSPPPQHIYKHIYVTEEPIKIVEKKKKKKKKMHKKEDKEWYDAFGCDSEDEEYEEEDE